MVSMTPMEARPINDNRETGRERPCNGARNRSTARILANPIERSKVHSIVFSQFCVISASGPWTFRASSLLEERQQVLGGDVFGVNVEQGFPVIFQLISDKDEC